MVRATNKKQALFLDKASLYPDDLDFTGLEDLADWQWFDKANPGDIGHSLQQAEIIVSNKVVLDRPILERCENLELICVAATGFNNIDVEAAKEKGVKVCNARAYATASVVQHVFSLVLSLNRKLSSYHRAAIDGHWAQSDFFCCFGEPISDLEGKTLGIIGYGELGKHVAKVAVGFGMDVIIARRNDTDKRAGRVPLERLLKQADVVSLHCPLTKANYHLISANELSLMKPSAILINTARGGLVDESALLEALKNDEIAAAGLDVLEHEPPAVGDALLDHHADNLIITPHIAWASQQSRQRLLNEIVLNIQAYQSGQLRNAIL
mgnify:FL=1